MIEQNKHILSSLKSSQETFELIDQACPLEGTLRAIKSIVIRPNCVLKHQQPPPRLLRQKHQVSHWIKGFYSLHHVYFLKETLDLGSFFLATEEGSNTSVQHAPSLFCFCKAACHLKTMKNPINKICTLQTLSNILVHCSVIRCFLRFCTSSCIKSTWSMVTMWKKLS